MKTPERELDDEINRCNNELKQRRALDTVERIDSAIDKFGEMALIHGFGIRAQNLSDAGRQYKETYDEELKELAIKYREKLDVSVEWRYLAKKLQLFTAVIDYNEKMHGNRSPEVDPSNLKEKYADL